MVTLHIGIDDTDSPRMGCTTYVASLLVKELQIVGVSFIDYPNLVRLNPNVPWKTRGNGALCLRFKCDAAEVGEIEETAVNIVEKNSDLDHEGTEPGLVFFVEDRISKELTAFAKQAIQSIVKMKNALNLIKVHKAVAVGFKTGRGIIGALAAIGETLRDDHTYELITYRMPSNRGTLRRVDTESVFRMNQKTKPLTFNNVDPKKRRILITPRGPDPILYGVRGQTASIVKKALQTIKCDEPIERWTIFRTNHGTDAHLRMVPSIQEIQAYNPVIVRGSVSKSPWVVPKRHVIFAINDATGQIDCAAYEPTGDLRKRAAELIVGDVIDAYGGVRPASRENPITLNLEKIRVISLAQKLAFQNPLCPNCGKRMESMGVKQGFRCDRCGFHSREIMKSMLRVGRSLRKTLYITSPRSQRHLTKPLSRYGMENMRMHGRMISQWFWVSDEPSSARS